MIAASSFDSIDLNCPPPPPQVCFGVAVHLSYHLKQSVIFIDTSGGLSARRLLQMLQAETANTGEQVSAGLRRGCRVRWVVWRLFGCDAM